METIMLHIKALRAVASLPPEDAVVIMNAMITLAEGGVPEVPEHLRFGWSIIQANIQDDMKRYSDVCEKRKKAIAKRWNKAESDTNVYNSIQMNTNDTSDTSDTSVSNTIQSNPVQSNTIQVNTEQSNTIQEIDKSISLNARAISAAHNTIPNNRDDSDYFPKTVDDAMRLARTNNVAMSREECELWLADRQSKNWWPNGRVLPLSAGKLGADMRKWHLMQRDFKNNNQQALPEKDYTKL